MKNLALISDVSRYLLVSVSRSLTFLLRGRQCSLQCQLCVENSQHTVDSLSDVRVTIVGS